MCTQHKLKELKNQLKLVALKFLIGSTVVFCFFTVYFVIIASLTDHSVAVKKSKVEKT